MIGALPQFRQRLHSSSSLEPLMVDVHCSGREQSFSECLMTSTETCSTRNLAGIHCQSKVSRKNFTCNITLTMIVL